MCGIAGVWRLRGPGGEREAGPSGGATLDAVGDAVLRRARGIAGRLRHRGPDACTWYRSPSRPLALGHTRLEVIDLETGDQPMGNEDGTIQVVYNGEIYNFRELRRELEGAGHRFRTRSDTEVIVHGYEAWGPDVVRRLDGMFAFGVWDEARGQLVLARDRAGQKPLFVYSDGRQLAFASELGALMADPEFDDALDPAAVPLYLAYGYVPAPATFYRRVRALPPATVLRLDAGVASSQDPLGAAVRYWAPEWGPGRDRWRSRTSASPREAVRGLLSAAVERRMIADVPLGAFLSGGIDSSLVVGLMSRLSDRKVQTFSIGFEDDPVYDETAYARLVAERFDTDHTEFHVGSGSVELLERLLDAYGEPFGDSSAIPTYLLSQAVRRHVTVALTGDGGDELFAGYPRFLGAVIAERTPGFVAAAGRRLTEWLPHDDDFRSPARRVQRFFRAASEPAPERTLRWIGFFPDLDRILRPEVRGLVSDQALMRSFRAAWERPRSATPLTRALALNFETYLPDDLLVKADRCSMAHGLELRSPFLDTDLIQFATALPDRWRIRRGALKVLLKSSFQDLLPPEILGRGKMGFGVPLPTWFRGPWRPLVESLLLSPKARILRWVRADAVGALVEEHGLGRADHGHRLWALCTLEAWLGRARFSDPETPS